MDGMELDPNAKETKIFNAIVELLDDLSVSVEEMEDEYGELAEQVDEIDHDLGALEEDFYGLEGEDEGCGCGCHHHHHHEDMSTDFGVNCPNCGADIPLTDEVLDAEEIICPGCGEKLEFEFEDEDDEDFEEEDGEEPEGEE
jgi:hypothetical protein